jgi:hypothetical protein
MDAECLVCSHCCADLREAGVVKVETGLTRHNLYYYHPHAHLFMEDALIERGDGADTSWLCRSCKRPLPHGIAAYICSHVGR